MPLGCDAEIHGRVDCAKDLEAVFVGSIPGHDEWRMTISDKLEKNDICHYVGGWHYEDMGKIYSRSKIILNHTYCDNKKDVNMRVFEAFCSGSYLLTQTLDNDDMHLLFPHDHYSEFVNDDDLFGQLKHILAYWPEYVIKAGKARQYVLDNYTYAKNISNLLGEL
jgi:spore maturation protein CgeB